MVFSVDSTAYTSRYFNSNTYANQNCINNIGIIDVIDECEMDDYRLEKPISVKIERDYNDWVVSDSITGVYSFGDTIGEAKQNFCFALEDVYKFLSEDFDHLTQINKNTYEYLKSILSEK